MLLAASLHQITLPSWWGENDQQRALSKSQIDGHRFRQDVMRFIASRPGKKTTTGEIAEYFGKSKEMVRNHMTRLANEDKVEQIKNRHRQFDSAWVLKEK